MQQIDEALHPEFVSVLRHAPSESMFTPVATASPAEHASEPLPASLTVIGLLSVLGKPLALSLGDTAWVRHQLPIEERALLSSAASSCSCPSSSQHPATCPLGCSCSAPGVRRSRTTRRISICW